MSNIEQREGRQTNGKPALIQEVRRRQNEAQEVQAKAQEMVTTIRAIWPQDVPYESAYEDSVVTLPNGETVEARTYTDSIFSPRQRKRMDYYDRFGRYPSEYLNFPIQGDLVEGNEELELQVEKVGTSGNYSISLTGLDEKLVVNSENGAWLESIDTEIVGEFRTGPNTTRPVWISSITSERLQQYEDLLTYAYTNTAGIFSSV